MTHLSFHWDDVLEGWWDVHVSLPSIYNTFQSFFLVGIRLFKVNHARGRKLMEKRRVKLANCILICLHLSCLLVDIYVTTSIHLYIYKFQLQSTPCKYIYQQSTLQYIYIYIYGISRWCSEALRDREPLIRSTMASNSLKHTYNLFIILVTSFNFETIRAQ